MWQALLPLVGTGISSLMQYFGAQQQSNATQANNLMNYQIAQQNFGLQREAMAQNAAQYERSLAAQLSENALTRQTNLDINARNELLQREFARHGIQMRVADAKESGIHPYMALGASIPTYSPSAHVGGGSVPSGGGSSPAAVSANFTPDTAMGSALGNMGQDISRALHAAAQQEDREKTINTASAVLGLENQKLRNEILKSQVIRLRQTPNPPMSGADRYLVPGQTQSGTNDKLVENKPMERTPGDPNNPAQEPGAITDIGHARTVAGNYAVVPGANVKERIEDVTPYEWSHFIRNAIMPAVSSKYFHPPKNVPLKQGHQWAFNPFTQEYHQVRTLFDHRFHGSTYRGR